MDNLFLFFLLFFASRRSKDGNKASILCEGRANRAGQHFCSAVQFELRHCDGKTWAVDMSANGTFLNIDEDAARAFKTRKQELAWLKEQNPDPRLAKDEGQQAFDGDQLYFRLSHDRTKREAKEKQNRHGSAFVHLLRPRLDTYCLGLGDADLLRRAPCCPAV